jgi:hypothetical protein
MQSPPILRLNCVSSDATENMPPRSCPRFFASIMPQGARYPRVFALGVSNTFTPSSG